MTPKLKFTLAIIAATALVPPALKAQELFTPGFVKSEVYTNITGTLVDDLRADPNYPASPGSTGYVVGLEAPLNAGDNYGIRLSGFVTPPTTGNYVFYISADDQ